MPVQAQESVGGVAIKGNLFGHSTADFQKGAGNTEFVIPAGSEGVVLETVFFPNTGNYGVRLRITKVPGKPRRGLAKKGDETWVYYSPKEPWLHFTKPKNAKGKKVDPEEENRPEVGDIVRAVKEGTGFKKKKNSSTEADGCSTCEFRSTSSAQDGNLKDLKKIQDKIKTSSQSAPAGSQWVNYPEVAKYSDSSEVKKTISYAMRNKRSHIGDPPRCYHYVKRWMYRGELVDPEGKIVNSPNAKNAVRDLKEQGYINMMEDPRYKGLIKNPDDAPKGAVLVYRNTRNAHHPGHVEIKTDWGDNGGYVAEVYRKNNQPLINRELIGVMIEESL